MNEMKITFPKIKKPSKFKQAMAKELFVIW